MLKIYLQKVLGRYPKIIFFCRSTWFWQNIQTDRFYRYSFSGWFRPYPLWLDTLRCPDSWQVLVIKDYAYETQGQVGIIAGDMGRQLAFKQSMSCYFLYPNPAEDWIRSIIMKMNSYIQMSKIWGNSSH